jgi:uncharacterized RDD family membrane protein YckC
MSDIIAFETPENIELNYHRAGLGTRFVAWFVDRVLLAVLMFVIFLGLLIAGAASDSVLRTIVSPVVDSLEGVDDGTSDSIVLYYLMGIVLLVLGLGNFFYFGLCELLWRGQTPGKRLSNIRVVKLDGFSLDAMSILLRNVFRVLDHLPLLWIVPLLSARQQRFGDMVAGTIVVQEQMTRLSGVREQLGARSASEMQFRIPSAALSKLTPDDFKAIETLLDRWASMPADRASDIRRQIATALSNKLKMDMPSVTDELRFLEDILAAECRRQSRRLG